MSIISMLLGEKKKSAAIAKERLQIILARECVNGSSAEPDYLPGTAARIDGRGLQICLDQPRGHQSKI